MEFEFDGRKSLNFELRTSDGKPAAQETGAPADGFLFGPFQITLPMGGILRFPLSWHGYGIRPNFGIMLCFQSALWEIPRSNQTTHFLSATLTIPLAPRDPRKVEA